MIPSAKESQLLVVPSLSLAVKRSYDKATTLADTAFIVQEKMHLYQKWDKTHTH